MEHVLLCHTVHEEDPAHSLDHLHKVEVEEILVPYSERDTVMVDDAEADGSVVAKEDKILHRPGLAHNVLAVASTDIILHNVQKMPVDPAVVILPSL